ncbi:hypothetical protein [Mycolicibacter hiberniae]|uniref:Uncharacterized protein n=1 Tax=Mycolicibacter hiberniae TaxID=29314 RepID=A0A7I7X774_9MYCO|nr:hypothetical protein [Mycolicibacter hiberniae]MCV7088230.1 hypothetical protein [Mycolicibacter hiberniae]ORV72831.1 hypothetical protein AWC09_03140 [Mycolicibacter hiberniae]BBZ25085.1 hypothetical protein MHIB_35030 [Mycolicibacter hiberniae]
MSTIAGLPAHMLLLHVVVALVPITAVLLIVCALWPAARRRLVWLLVVFSAITLLVTPLTVTAGEWLADTGKFAGSPELDAHMAAGGYGLYMAVGLAIATALLVGLHVALSRGSKVGPLLRAGVVAVVIALASGAMLAIHNIGSTGTEAAWGNLLTASDTD